MTTTTDVVYARTAIDLSITCETVKYIYSELINFQYSKIPRKDLLNRIVLQNNTANITVT